MPTQKPGLRSVEEFMTDYKPVYNPVYPLLLAKSKKYQEEVGETSFRRVETVGDIRAKRITPKDTVIQRLSATESSKTFKKYFDANQFVLSHLQNPEGREQVVAQVLDEHQKQFDERVLTGDGTANNNVINNGLFFSGDANYTTESSVEIDSTSRLLEFHNKVITTATKADLVDGRKVIMFYGANILPLFNSLYESAAKAWKQVLGEVLGSNYTLMALPASVTPASNHGWLIANLDQIEMHYTMLPQLRQQGSNEEEMYDWFNFMMGSAMVEVLQPHAIIRQPATLEA
jgi:hypothetical protein